MATDSLKFVNENYVTRIHGTAPSGKLHKGHNITAATASIPSKYQTIVTDNSDRKGFLSRSRRFQHDALILDDHPGPGTYVSHTPCDKNTPSISKKGTGGFASKDSRLHKLQVTASPGAGTYNLPSMLISKKDHNKASATSAFHPPIAKTKDKPGNPAPNVYDVLKAQATVNRTNNVVANAAFKSQTKREFINLKEMSVKPAPGQYFIKEDLVKESVKVPVSSFISKTVRQLQPSPPPYPGPGTYRPHEQIEPVQKMVFPKKHYLCISAPAMPLPDTPPAPGPGSYEIVNYDGTPKHYMSSAAFVSTTSRWTGDTSHHVDLPGPAHYRPIQLGKQSFIYNAGGKWI